MKLIYQACFNPLHTTIFNYIWFVIIIFVLSDPEKAMATHSSILAWRIPGMGEPGGLPSMGLHRVGHDWRDLAATAVAALSDLFVIVWYELCCLDAPHPYFVYEMSSFSWLPGLTLYFFMTIFFLTVMFLKLSLFLSLFF